MLYSSQSWDLLQSLKIPIVIVYVVCYCFYFFLFRVCQFLASRYEGVPPVVTCYEWYCDLMFRYQSVCLSVARTNISLCEIRFFCIWICFLILLFHMAATGDSELDVFLTINSRGQYIHDIHEEVLKTLKLKPKLSYHFIHDVYIT